MSEWDKPIWKEWLTHYQDAYNALQNFLIQLNSNVLNGTKSEVVFWEDRFEQDDFTIDVILNAISSNGV